MGKKKSLPEIISGYLNWYRTKEQIYWWAWKEVEQMTSPDDLHFIYQLIETCLNDAEIAYVAAGPLEDLFVKHHLEVKESLDQMASQNKNMRKAVQAMFLAPNTPERQALDTILRKYGLVYASL